MPAACNAFRLGLAEGGYIEGRNVRIEFRWAEGQPSRLPALAAELASRSLDVIVAPGGAPVALAAKAATNSIPIVFEMGADPVALGLVETLSRPGGNLTGVASLNVDLTPKRLQLLLQVMPAGRPAAVLVNPTSPTTDSQLTRVEAAAREMKVPVHVVRAAGAHELGGRLRPGACRQRSGAGRGLGHLLRLDERAAGSARAQGPAACHHPDARLSDCGWLDELRRQLLRVAPHRRRLCGTHPQRRVPGGPAGPTGDRVRVLHQPEDGQERSASRCPPVF